MSGSPSVLEVLERAARGEAIAPTAVQALMRAWTGGAASDAQMASFCMAVQRHGMEADAIDALIDEIVASGDRLDLSESGIVVDLRAPSGPGSAQLVVVAAALAASMGAGVSILEAPAGGPVPGLLDLLAAVDGMQIAPSLGVHVRRVLGGATSSALRPERIAPADAALGELRAATGTLGSPALTAASLAAGVVAGGAAVGGVALASGPEGERMAAAIGAALDRWGRRSAIVVTSDDGVSGRSFGVALGLAEAGRALASGSGPLADAACGLAGRAAEVCGVVAAESGEERAHAALADGTALAAAERWVAEAGGDPRIWTDPGLGTDAPVQIYVDAADSGHLQVDPAGLAEAIRWSGAGRMHRDQGLDVVAGVQLLVDPGAEVEIDEPVAVVHGRDLALAKRARDLLVGAIRIAPKGGASA